MAKLKDQVTRKNLPDGKDGEALVLDSNSPDGLRWAPGIDRLVTDIAPELAGDLDASDYSITGINNLEFTDAAGTVAGIQNGNLVDRTAAASVAGLTALTFTGATGTIGNGGDLIQNQNLLDKTADETIGGAWTYDDAIAMDDNKITGLGDPTADQDAATKTYVDTQHAGYICASGTWGAVALGGTLSAGANWMAASTVTFSTPHINSGWTEASSEFEYTGTYPASGAKIFLVQYSMTLSFYSTGAAGGTVSLAGRITKDTGSGHALVPGSMEVSEAGYYSTGFGAYFHFHAISGSCIVSMEEDDTIAFNFGTFGFGSYIPVAYATTAGTEGATVVITPIG